MSGQIPKETCERTQLRVVVGAQEVQYHRQHALLLQSHMAEHRSPLQDRGQTALIYPRLTLSGSSRSTLAVSYAAYTLVSGGDVLQSSSGCLAGGGVDLALMQHAVVHAHYLGVPEPLHLLGQPGNLGEGGDVLVVALPGGHNAALLRTGSPRSLQ